MKLEEWMKRKRITAAELARKIGVSRSSVHLWLCKNRAPKYSNYLKIKELSNGRVKFEDFFKK